MLCEINKITLDGFYYNAGKIRTTPVAIGGTKWKPEIPIESVVKEQLQEILTSNLSELDKAIELLLFVMKKQIFIDGNKRTSVIFANHVLIKNGLGLIVIPDDMVNHYRDLLIAYYENNDTEIKRFLRDNCYLKI